MKPALKRWLIIVGAVVLVTIAAFTVFKHWAGTSSEGTVHTGKPKSNTATTPVPTTSLAIDTPYFTTTVPGGFTLDRQSDTPSNPTLLQYSAHSKDQQIGITIGVLPADGLKGLGDYNLRVTQTQDYTEYRPAGIPVDSVGFRTTSGTPAFTVFWPHGGTYAEIAMSSDTGTSLGQLFATFEQASHNWQWR